MSHCWFDAYSYSLIIRVLLLFLFNHSALAPYITHHAGRQQICCYSPVSAFTWFKSTDGGFSSRSVLFFIDHPSATEIELRRKMSVHKWNLFQDPYYGFASMVTNAQKKEKKLKIGLLCKNHYCYTPFLFVLLNVDWTTYKECVDSDWE